MNDRQTSGSTEALIERALRAHQEGRFPEAESIYREVLVAYPTRADVLHFLGLLELQRGAADEALSLLARSLSIVPENQLVICHLAEAHRQRGEFEAAAGYYRRALAISPLLAEAHNGLGIVLQVQGRADEAATEFAAAISARPEWGDAYFNLGLSRKENGGSWEAAKAFARGWICERQSLNAAGQCVATLADLVRGHATESEPLVRRRSAQQPLPFISIVFCSIDDNKCSRTIALYERLLSDCRHEIIAIRDAHSLSEAYNCAVEKCRGEVIVLSHDDIDILDDDFAIHLCACLNNEFDAIGVVGGTTMHGPTWASSGHPNLRGWITHRTDSGKYMVGVLHPSAVSRGLMTLDGVFLAARADVFKTVPFDEVMFDGFHLYDIDWSYRAAQTGFRLGTVGELMVVHDSRGKFDAAMKEYATRFCFKHQVEVRRPASSITFEAELSTVNEVRRFFGLLGKLVAKAD